jgi:hypothetical protein
MTIILILFLNWEKLGETTGVSNEMKPISVILSSNL